MMKNQTISKQINSSPAPNTPKLLDKSTIIKDFMFLKQIKMLTETNMNNFID